MVSKVVTALLTLSVVQCVGALVVPQLNPSHHAIKSALRMSEETSFERIVDLPPTRSVLKAQMKIQPILSVPSEIVEVRYDLPFGLDVAPKDGMAVCNKDGAGGERVGDVLRYTSQWTMGLPRGDGMVTTVASFGGILQWQCSMYDVMQAAQWQEVIDALVSNVDSRTDEVVLLFERPLE